MTPTRWSGAIILAIHFVRDDGNPKGVHLFQWVKDVDAYFKEVVRSWCASTLRNRQTSRMGSVNLVCVDINGVGIVFGQDIDHV